ncbi:hypothetical protein [Peribacillus glennii]|uniref:Lipoprotein n=1 Tax=Peribacillus glennii TaxID=2303991 RepID=A0A372L7F5_9BACI|nr:hypothetical protein [Peribacillus glennii]RFU61140.1 hypothetical protein D0466_19365 [Peribacillus glennii]
MKKLWLLGSAFTLALGLAACSDKTEGESAEKETAASEKDLKGSMVRFYGDLTKTINEKDADLNAYELAEEKPTPDMKTKAGESAAAVAEAVKTVEIPVELKDQKADIEAALKDVTDSYQVKADELKKDAPSLDSANETLSQAEEKLGKAFESVKLMKVSLLKEVN